MYNISEHCLHNPKFVVAFFSQKMLGRWRLAVYGGWGGNLKTSQVTTLQIALTIKIETKKYYKIHHTRLLLRDHCHVSGLYRIKIHEHAKGGHYWKHTCIYIFKDKIQAKKCYICSAQVDIPTEFYIRNT